MGEESYNKEMRNFSYFLIFLLSYSALAQKKDFWVTFGPEKVVLQRLRNGFINHDCKKCQASASPLLNVKVSAEELINKNPGSVHCEKREGKVIIGKLYSGHSQSFCQFKDKSLISVNIFLQ